MTTALPDFPRYVSHKTVAAFKINSIITNPKGELLVRQLSQDCMRRARGPDDVLYFEIVTAAWCRKNAPDGVSSLVGGYLVAYEDGYRSWSPSATFEAGYTAELDEPIQHSDELVARTPGEKAAYLEGVEEGKLQAKRDAAESAGMSIEQMEIQDYAEQHMLTLEEAADQMRAPGEAAS